MNFVLVVRVRGGCAEWHFFAAQVETSGDAGLA
jgi:hypothetical protein